MSRRFNFTGRVKIRKEDVKVVLEPRKNRLVCAVHLRLAPYRFKSDAFVVVEAERGRVLRVRNQWGPADRASILDGATAEFDITSMGDPEDIRFRILVVERDTCRLLATAEGIEAHNRQDGETPQRSILPIVMRDLQGGVWELENMEDTPTLVLDSNLGTKQELKSSPILLSLLPGVIRAILSYLAHEHQGNAQDDEYDPNDGGSSGLWMELGAKWAGCSYQSGTVTIQHRDVDDWAQKAVTGFCREKRLRNHLATFMTQED